MPKSTVLHGARAIVYMGNTPLGIFNHVSTGVAYDLQPVWILGRSSAAETVYTGMELIEVSCSGFRAMEHGPFAVVDSATGASLVPKLQDILTYQDITISLHDRLESDPSKGNIMTITQCKPRGFQSGVGSRALQDLNVTFVGLHLSDESGENNEAPGAAELPAISD